MIVPPIIAGMRITGIAVSYCCFCHYAYSISAKQRRRGTEVPSIVFKKRMGSAGTTSLILVANMEKA
jgi:hypothetical protein